MRRPVIGVTCCSEVGFRKQITLPPQAILNSAYLSAVIRAGGAPVTLPNGDAGAELLPELDGLILTGGHDVDVNLYHQNRHPMTDEPDTPRDSFERAAIDAAVKANLPILGICRGIEILNVHFGGSLYQHLPDVMTSTTAHAKNSQADDPTHYVRLAPSALTQALGGGADIFVNSRHHQAIKNVANRFEAVGWAPDGVIEAMMSTDGMIWAVQWHPEDMHGVLYEHGAKLFAAFVERCRKRAAVGV